MLVSALPALVVVFMDEITLPLVRLCGNCLYCVSYSMNCMSFTRKL